MITEPMKTLQLYYPIIELCYPTEMVIRLKIAVVVCVVLFALMEDVNPLLAKRCYGDCKYRRLEARVKKLEDALCDLDLDCNRKAISLSKHFWKQTNINCFCLNFVSVCSMIKNLTALVETITDQVPPKRK